MDLVNGIWSWWQFSFRFWTKWNSICFKIRRKTVTTIISQSVPVNKNLYRNYIFPNDLVPNGIQLRAKSVGKSLPFVVSIVECSFGSVKLLSTSGSGTHSEDLFSPPPNAGSNIIWYLSYIKRQIISVELYSTTNPRNIFAFSNFASYFFPSDCESNRISFCSQSKDKLSVWWYSIQYERRLWV